MLFRSVSQSRYQPEAVAGVLSDQDSYPDVEYIDVLDAIDPLNPDAVEDKVLALASAHVDFIAAELDVDPEEVNAVLDDVPSGWMTEEINQSLTSALMSATATQSYLVSAGSQEADAEQEFAYMEPVGIQYVDGKLQVDVESFLDAFLEAAKNVTVDLLVLDGSDDEIGLSDEEFDDLGTFLQEMNSMEQYESLRWRVHLTSSGSPTFTGYGKLSFANVMMNLGVPSMVNAFGASGIEEPDWFNGIIAGKVMTDARFTAAIATLNAVYSGVDVADEEPANNTADTATQTVSEPKPKPTADESNRVVTQEDKKLLFEAMTSIRKMASKNSPKLRKVLDRMKSEDGYVYSEGIS